MKVYVLCINWEGGQAVFATLEEALAQVGTTIDAIEEWTLGDPVWWEQRPVVWRRDRQ